MTKDLTGKIQAGKVIGPVAQKVGGKGGGRPDLAEAGGKDPGALDAALGEVYGVVEALLEITSVVRYQFPVLRLRARLCRLLHSDGTGGRMKNRIRFISHKHKKILLVDGTGCTPSNWKNSPRLFPPGLRRSLEDRCCSGGFHRRADRQEEPGAF